MGIIQPAQAQSEADKRREQERHKARPPAQQAPARPATPPSSQGQGPKQMAPDRPAFQRPSSQDRPAFQKQPPQLEKPAFQKQTPPPERPAFQKPAPALEKPAFQKQLPPQERPAARPGQPPGMAVPSQPKGAPDFHKDGVKRPSVGQPGLPPPPAKGGPPAFQKPPAPIAQPPGGGPVGNRPATAMPHGPAPKHFDDLKKLRQERVEEGGRRVIEEPGKRFIIKEQGRTIVRHDESERFLRRPGARSERRPDGNVETFYVRPDGVRVVTVVDGHGRLLRRFRRDPDGRERNYIDNRRFYRNVAIGVGAAAVLGVIALNLPPPRVTIPRERYIVDYDNASEDDIYEALEAPPIEVLDRAYSLEEIRDNYELRARVRSVDINTINFDFGAWEVPPDQHDKLERVARAIHRVLERSPEAVFMIAGHTDAVGSDEDNASLSDRRAAAVADVLTDVYRVPAENLVTQGYGEQYLKIDTQGPEPANRRVSIQNLSGLMAER